MIAQITAACILGAASAYNLTPLTLEMILKTEGGHVGACTVQHNGMHDCGPAQVNAEIWVPRFAELLHRPIPKIFYALRDNGCFNIYAAAYILRVKITEADGNVWDGMGRYNNAKPPLKHAYQKRLIEAYRKLFPAQTSAAVNHRRVKPAGISKQTAKR